jgi:signal transduction histidine kinase
MRGNLSRWQPYNWPLRTKLAVNFALVILLGVGAVILIIELLAVIRIGSVTTLLSRERAYRLTPVFVEYYHQHNSWQGVERVAGPLTAPLPSQLTANFPYFPLIGNIAYVASKRNERIIITNVSGHVIFDTANQLAVGQPLPPELAPFAVPLTANGRAVGQLLYPSAFDQALLSAAQRTLRRTLALSGVVAAIGAIMFSLYLANRLTRPVRRLSDAARQYAHGRQNQPLPVESADELGLLTETFNEMTAALERQEQLRTQMVADIAHELRTPLSVMKLEVEGMADGLQTTEEASISLYEEIEGLQRLVEDLRQLSLADAGAVSLNLAVMELGPLLRQTAAVWQIQAEKSDRQLVTDIPPNLPPICGDRDRLGQVLTNLLSNALRYTPPGGRISLGALGDQAGVQLWVADSGPGIAAEDLPHVFERFYRTDQSRSRDTGGSGLGLAIAKQWVLLHGGRIWAENGPDGGAQFSVSLPAAGSYPG